MIVIDVGCATYGGDASIPDLVAEFKPDVLLGFDPSELTRSYESGDTDIIIVSAAAWTYDGVIGFVVAGLGGHVDSDAPNVACLDLAALINDQATKETEVVLKMDAEGAEYTVLPHLVAHDADLRLKMALIEWHCEWCGLGGNGRHREACEVDREWWTARRMSVETTMRCEMREWNR